MPVTGKLCVRLARASNSLWRQGVWLITDRQKDWHHSRVTYCVFVSQKNAILYLVWVDSCWAQMRLNLFLQRPNVFTTANYTNKLRRYRISGQVSSPKIFEKVYILRCSIWSVARIDGLHTARSKEAKQHSVYTLPFCRQTLFCYAECADSFKV